MKFGVIASCSGFVTDTGGAAAISFINPTAAASVFTLAGSGEAVDRAIKKGATEEQIVTAAALGVVPGLTDSAPIEVLLGRIPIPGGKFVGKFIEIPVGAGRCDKGGRRIGFQALIEGIQEGGQQFLQNVIQQTYDEDQKRFDGVGQDATIGSTVGAILEAAVAPFRTHGGSAQICRALRAFAVDVGADIVLPSRAVGRAAVTGAPVARAVKREESL